MEPRKRILEGASELFRRKGAKAVTMDDIAEHLGMSKKTLYEHFENKREVVFAVVDDHVRRQMSELKQYHEGARDAVHEIILLIRWIGETFNEVSPIMISDTQKYYPGAWKLVEDFKKDFILRTIRENLQRGKKEGLYREELDVEVLARLRLREVELCMDPDVFPPHQFDFTRVNQQAIVQFLSGASTLKGRKLINKYLNRNEED